MKPNQFRDPALHVLALTHASAANGQSNERLEFLGDSVLGLVIAEALHQRHPELDEGALTERKGRLVSRVTLARAARMLALADSAILGQGLRKQALPVSVLANLYEAMVGAIFLDQGFDAARAFVMETLREDLETEHAGAGLAHPKQQLQHYAQARQLGLPQYVLLEQRGDAHERVFCIQAELAGERFTPAWGRTRREAESWAAHEALLILAERDQPA